MTSLIWQSLQNYDMLYLNSKLVGGASNAAIL